MRFQKNNSTNRAKHHVAVITVTAFGVVIAPQSAAAVESTETVCAAVDQRTDFTGDAAARLVLDPFDTSLGQFVQADLTATLGIRYDDRAEIADNPVDNPYSVTQRRAASASIQLPDGSVLAAQLESEYTVNDLISEGAAEAPFGTDADGNDVPGDDGFTRSGASDDVARAITSTDIDAWTGTTTVEVIVNGTATTNLTGSGNVVEFRNTFIAGEVCVTYSYLELVSIGDYVWFDIDRDGLQSSDEPGGDEVTVVLLDADGTEVTRTATNADGFYSFVNLVAGDAYSVRFEPVEGVVFTTADAGGDAIDSDAGSDGLVAVVAPTVGSNSSADPDDPTYDAGLLAYDLTIDKRLANAATVAQGDTVSFTIVPSNLGPVDALAGWSVTDVLPDGLDAVSIGGLADETTYECNVEEFTCVSSVPLPAGGEAEAIVVEARVTVDEATVLRNVAYITPVGGDIVELIPLGEPPVAGTDTDQTDTNNDSHDEVTVVPSPPTSDPTRTVQLPPPPVTLPATGTSSAPGMSVLAMALLLAGAGALALSRRPRPAN